MHAMLFVDDPVRGNPLRPTADAIRALDGEDWLSTILIDHLLQTTLKVCVPDHVLIGSSDCYSYFSTYNDKLDKHDCADAVQTMRGGLKAYAKSEFRYISAACHQGHYFVVDVTFDSRQPAIFQQVNVYDSLSITSRQRATAVLVRDSCTASAFMVWTTICCYSRSKIIWCNKLFSETARSRTTATTVASLPLPSFGICLRARKSIRRSSHKTILAHYVRRCTEGSHPTQNGPRSRMCKGLNSALGNVFPANHKCYCESNNGKKFASMVTALSETTSLPEKRALLTQLQQKSPGAYKYVTDIDANRWMDSAWLEDEKLPPRYGFRNSNT
ncbi:hypothetical protein IV203_011348 [Nitzschia inconspicua]|uniref:Uncharacterized protein n=1 Tax=Nitzschia inconspicua TaxID=303405 RepID=A0A9K3KSJ8_9STRA|nr:hypothetical protein IV203_011348 [Nitzschia inconspicua]